MEGNYRGHDGIREFMADAFETLEVLRIDHREMRDLGDRVLALKAFQTHGTQSGIQDDVPFAIVATVREGLIVYLKDHGNRMLALEAAELSE